LAEELEKLGFELTMEILQECSSEEWASWERYWIALGARLGEKLINLMPGGQNPPRQNGSAWRGRRHSAETLRKMSDAKVGKHPPNYGKKMSLELREKNSKGHIGLKHSRETRKRMSASHLGMNTWSRGRKLSEEHCAKVSESVKKWWSVRKSVACR